MDTTRRRRWRGSIGERLVVLVLAVGLPLVAANVYSSWTRYALARGNAELRVRQAAELMAQRVDDWVESAEVAFLALNDAVQDRWDDREAMDRLLGDAARISDPRFANFLVVDTLGVNRGSGVPTPDRDTIDYLGRDYYRAAMREDGVVVGAPRRSFVVPGRPWIVVLARALRTPVEERRIGIIGTPMRVDTLADFVAVASFRSRPLVSIFDTTGTIVARSSNPEAFIGRNVFTRAGRPPADVWADSTTVSRVTAGDDTTRLTATTRARRLPWIVNVGVPVSEFEGPLRAQFLTDLALSLLALGLGVGVAVSVGGRIARPIGDLADDARAFADGLPVRERHDERAPAEIRSLRDTFRGMAGAVATRTEALAESERRYRLLFESNPLPMWAWDADSLAIVAVNEAAIEHYGHDRERFLAMTIEDLLVPDERERFRASRQPFTEGRRLAGVWRHRTASGREVEMEVLTTSSRRIGTGSWLSIGIDVTARREAERALAASEEQLRQSQKMEAIGAFAGGIAHDFNNLLTGILGYCELALGSLPLGDPGRDDVQEIAALAERGAQLTRQILTVSRKQVVQPTDVDVNAAIGQLDGLFRRLVGEHIRLGTRLAPDVGHVRADPGQLDQVLLNLVANARDAMPDGGELVLATRIVPAAQAATLDLPSRDWVEIRVTDDGVGMSPELQARIFEPFFTTKERGKGTGLGLALAYAIVRQADGVIRCESTPGAGTTFRIWLPVSRSAEAGVPSAAAVTDERTLDGTETILLVEDEAPVRAVASAALERRGYRILAAPDGPSALALAAAEPGPIHLLLSDVVMPGMTGREVAERLRAIRPATRVLFVSGYADDAVLRRGVRVDEVPFLQKPFTPLSLVRKVREVLDQPAA